MRSLLRIFACMALAFLFYGCNHHEEQVVRLRLDQIAYQRYVLNDAVPVVEYEGNGIVRYVTRRGESGEIDLKRHTIQKDTGAPYRQYGMPYQLIDSIALVSSSDKGIQVGGRSLIIPDKGNHYSAYRSVQINPEGDILSVTSDGIFLFGKDDVGRRLYPDPAKGNSIDIVRFVDLCYDSRNRTYYAAGPPGVVKIKIDDKGEVSIEEDKFFRRSGIKVTHIRVDYVGGNKGIVALVAYADDGKVYRKKAGSEWWEDERSMIHDGITVSFFEKDALRELRLGFDRPTEVWEKPTGENGVWKLQALIDDEESTGMQTLNGRIHCYAVEAEEYGYVIARGRYIYTVSNQVHLSPSQPVISICQDGDVLYFKAGTDGEMSHLYRVKISKEGWTVGAPEYLRTIPRYGELIGVVDKEVIVRSGEEVLRGPLKVSRWNRKKTKHYERLVQVRMDDKGELLCLTQNALIAYGDTLDYKMALRDDSADPAEYYPQTFVSIIGGENPEVAISTIHRGIVVLKKQDKRIWVPIRVEGNTLLERWEGHPDPVVLMEKAPGLPGGNGRKKIFLYTQRGRVCEMSYHDGSWILEVKNDRPQHVDVLASSGDKELFGVDYFSSGCFDAMANDKQIQYANLNINDLCYVPEKGFVFACKEGIYATWVNNGNQPIPVLYQRNPRLAKWLPIGLIIFFTLPVLLIAVLILGWGHLKKGKQKETEPTAGREAEDGRNVTASVSPEVDSSETIAFKDAWAAFSDKIDPSYARFTAGLGRLVSGLIGDNWAWGCAICRQLESESGLVNKYFEFLLAIQECYREKKYDEDRVEPLFLSLLNTVSLTPTAKDEFDALRISNNSKQRQVRTFFILPIKIDKPDYDEVWFDGYVHLSTHYGEISSYRNGSGTFFKFDKQLNEPNPLVKSRRAKTLGIGLILLIPMWADSQFQIGDSDEDDTRVLHHVSYPEPIV